MKIKVIKNSLNSVSPEYQPGAINSFRRMYEYQGVRWYVTNIRAIQTEDPEYGWLMIPANDCVLIP